MQTKVDLSSFNNYPYHPQASYFRQTSWFFINALFLKTSLVPISRFKVFLLRLFGAKIGKRVNIKPCVSIKYPWLLEIGDHAWIGENTWIDNLVLVKIGAHTSISQGAMLLTGNHHYKKSSFDLITGSIILEEGVWIGAQATVCPGVHAGSHSILTVGSVATKNLDAYSIYQGNPAVKIRNRVIENN